MATHSSILASRIPWTEEPGGLLSMGSQRVRHDLVTEPSWDGGKESSWQCRRPKGLELDPWVRKIPCSRKWQPTPVLSPGECYAQRSLAGYSPRGRKQHATFTYTDTCNHFCLILGVFTHTHTHTHTHTQYELILTLLISFPSPPLLRGGHLGPLSQRRSCSGRGIQGEATASPCRGRAEATQ